MPNFNQLQQTIAQGDDSINNRLILNVNGDFELRPFNDATDDYNFQRLNYVTRWETFDAGNDYVGIDASNDQRLLDGIMDWANKAWAEHQASGQTKILNPTI